MNSNKIYYNDTLKKDFSKSEVFGNINESGSMILNNGSSISQSNLNYNLGNNNNFEFELSSG
jgi:hypothetical protein